MSEFDPNLDLIYSDDDDDDYDKYYKNLTDDQIRKLAETSKKEEIKIEKNLNQGQGQGQRQEQFENLLNKAQNKLGYTLNKSQNTIQNQFNSKNQLNNKFNQGKGFQNQNQNQILSNLNKGENQLNNQSIFKLNQVKEQEQFKLNPLEKQLQKEQNIMQQQTFNQQNIIEQSFSSNLNQQNNIIVSQFESSNEKLKNQGNEKKVKNLLKGIDYSKIDYQGLLDEDIPFNLLNVRAGGGGKKLLYIDTEKIITMGNKIFGVQNWSTKVKKVDKIIDNIEKEHTYYTTLQVKANIGGKIVKKEDIGIGSSKEIGSAKQTYYSILKGSQTDAIKRCFRQFGRLTGNCLYDPKFRLKYDTEMRRLKRIGKTIDENEPALEKLILKYYNDNEEKIENSFKENKKRKFEDMDK